MNEKKKKEPKWGRDEKNHQANQIIFLIIL